MDARSETVRKLYEQGLTLQDMHEHTGIAVSTMRNWIQKLGLLRRVKCPHDNSMREMVKQLRDEGLSMAQIGRKVGLSRCAVAGLIKRMNLPHREKPARVTRGTRAKTTPTRLVAPVQQFKPITQIPPVAGATILNAYGAVCRYPVGPTNTVNGAPICGHEATHMSYCLFHAMLCYQRVPQPEAA